MKNIFIIMTLLSCLSFSSLSAHPHMFVDTYFDVQMSNDRLKKITVSWVMDEMTSMTLLMDYDQNRDRKFDAAETAVVKQDAFDHLEELDYLTYVGINGQRVKTQKAEDFTLLVQEGRVVYRFSLVPSMSSQAITEIKLGCFDPENFMAMIIDQERSHIAHDASQAQVDLQVIFEDYEFFVADMLLITVHS